jgi:hypothetical protein
MSNTRSCRIKAKHPYKIWVDECQWTPLELIVIHPTGARGCGKTYTMLKMFEDARRALTTSTIPTENRYVWITKSVYLSLGGTEATWPYPDSDAGIIPEPKEESK